MAGHGDWIQSGSDDSSLKSTGCENLDKACPHLSGPRFSQLQKGQGGCGRGEGGAGGGASVIEKRPS